LEKERVFASAEYQTFHQENCEWLEPYAWFCFLRDRYGTVDFQAWSADQQYNAKRLRQLAEAEPGVREAVEFFFFVQFHLDRQLREAAEYAHRLGVVLKGDLAIGVSRQGADVWEAPELFHLDMQAGAPPDSFAARGQNWGFPTYNWQRMADDGYRWWGRRFSQMSRYFDAFRVDHILGFFRIWSIPQHAVEGVLGYFVPVLPVRPGEFAARGIAFEARRFIEPYITDDVLKAVFGEKAEWVKERCLEPEGPAKYGLKPAFRTQAAVKAWFQKSESATLKLEARTATPEPGGNGGRSNATGTSTLAEIGSDGAKLKRGLFELISNVLLLQEQPAEIPSAGPPASGGEALHFRFGMDQTSSFQALDTATQSRLWDLYVDYFYRRQERLWREEGLKKLPWLQRATSLLVCGEDLGMVPDCVPKVMRELGILALEVQRMPKRSGHSFARPADAGYLSVVTPSTHDMSPVREWWEQDRALTQRFYNDELGQPGEAPAECQPWICQAILEQHLRSPAMWSLFQLQDLLGMDATLRRPDAAAERINIPSDSAQRWRYRMHLNLETLLQAEEFNTRLAGMIRAAGRGH
ncbi:MAG TPA: 4-alpha-glucanotransferase, partial [Candidatus Paceibacterota bacterium]|nr:4-alpha-glucanotransferase [Candidatus Paceibacterota bacterium]